MNYNNKLDIRIIDFLEKENYTAKIFINSRYYVRIEHFNSTNETICKLYNYKKELIKELNEDININLETKVIEVYNYALKVMKEHINSKHKYQAQNEFDKENVKHYGLKLNKNTDRDIIEWLSQKDNLQGYIKKLIRKDIIRNS